MDRIKKFWLDQTTAEYSSSARTINLAHWMQQAGMSPSIIRDAIRIADEEMLHAQMCYQVANEAGSQELLSQKSLSLTLSQKYPDLRKCILDVIVESFCFGETVAVPLFKEMNKNATIKSVLNTYKQILHDEPQHSQFGWLTLAWCHENWPETGCWLREITPNALATIKEAYTVGEEDDYTPPLSTTEIEWGMMPKYSYTQVLGSTVKGIFSKRMKHYDIELSA